MNNIIEITNLGKTFGKGANQLEILKDINLSLKKGENIALIGPSGCGKTTLLQIMGLLDKASSGSIKIKNKECNNLSLKEKTQLRQKYFGFIYQFHYLMPEFTALENIMMPLLLNNIDIRTAKKRASIFLDDIGLADKANKRPNSLSGGEKQRIAIARAMINKPEILFADEPTGNLDPKNAENILDIFLTNIKKYKQTTIIVTHNEKLAKNFRKIITIEKGSIKYL
jgi:lipoprotein-releasing system ATP-binding protein